MKDWLPIIEYRDFWDFPRIFFVKYLSKKYLFDNEFDEQTEDFSDTFKIYLMPQNFKVNSYKSWKDIHHYSSKLIGEIPFEDVYFDKTKREYVDGKILDRLFTNS